MSDETTLFCKGPNAKWASFCGLEDLGYRFLFDIFVKKPTAQVSMDGQWTHTVRSIPTLEYYSTMKRSEALTQAITWRDPEDMVLSERSRHKRTNTQIHFVDFR
jgi:hypothetical protein